MATDVAIAGGTKIEWADMTFNPWWGCLKVSPGCAHCYAEKVSNHRSGKGNWGADHGFRFFGDKHWDEPLRWARNLPAKLGRRPRVFCASMADVFEERPDLEEPRLRLFELIAATPSLDWLILTKRPEFARDWLRGLAWEMPGDGTRGRAENYQPSYGIPASPLPNVWMGVSIENARYTWRADVLREIPAAVRFISAEPLLGSLYERSNDRRAVQPAADELRHIRAPLDLSGIDWVIIGGESGGGARPFHLEHAREIIRASFEMCRGRGALPYKERRPSLFVKQLGAKPVSDDALELMLLNVKHGKGGDMSEWPADLRIREFPRSIGRA